MAIDSLHAIPSPHAATARIDHPRTLKYRVSRANIPIMDSVRSVR